MRALITGATGFIGRRLAESLLREGFDVTALVRSKNHRLPAGTHIFQGDILEPDTLANAGADHDRLYHLAGLITFDPRFRQQLLSVNGQGTANVLSAAHQGKVGRCIVVSSACTIGITENANEELHEDCPPPLALAKVNPYLASKLLCERIAVAWADKLHVVIVNPTTVYGPGDYGMNSGSLVRTIATSRLVPLPSGGSNVMDVDDVVSGILAAGEYGQTGRRYILAGTNLSFAQIYSTVREVVGTHTRFLPLPSWMRIPTAAASAVLGRILSNRFVTFQLIKDLFAFKYYSSERAKRELGWLPQRSFKESIERAWAFYRQTGLISH